MRAEGFEPPSSCEHRDLNPACRPFQHARDRCILWRSDRLVWEHVFVRAKAEIETAAALLSKGLTSTEVAARTGIPRSTIRDWRLKGISRGSKGRNTRPCPICDFGVELMAPAYAYLFGLYLGDGCVSEGPRTYVLRLFLDAAYPAIVCEARAAMEAVRPGQRAWAKVRRSSRCHDVVMCSNHWPCLFPQHGPGRKHERPILLAAWQRSLVADYPRQLVRGLIHSDGCRVVANDRGLKSVRYHFSNRSEDIKRIYTDALDALGVQWTGRCDQQIAVYRKASVAVLDEFVGPKK